MYILSLLLNLAWLVLFILVLIKQFKTAGPIHGIIGIITCSLWTFIWGWLNAGKLNIRNLMIIWTIVIVLCIVFGIVGGGMAAYYGVTQGGVPVTP
jgi:hypothetical protein